MSDEPKPEAGSINWFDLTVPDADGVRDFYAAVAGWKPEPLDMGGYSDFSMNAPGSGRTVAGVCHALGSTANLPPQWLIYITVTNLEHRIRKFIELGGRVVDPAREMGDMGRISVIRDPAGAVCALFEPTGGMA